MTLEIINKLFLELSQIATAKTARERKLEQDIAYWVQLAKEQRHCQRTPTSGGIPMPTDAAIAVSESLIGREVAHPSMEARNG